MINDQNILMKALEYFYSDKNGCYLVNKFNKLSTYLYFDKKQPQNRHKKIIEIDNRIVSDLWNIATLLERLEWTRINTEKIHHLREAWMYYAKVDISHFHTEIRSVLDHTAKTIDIFSSKPGQIPPSFRKLLENLNRYKNKIDPGIYKLLEEIDWFREIQEVRDSLIHEGAETLVFGEPQEGILFQVYRGSNTKQLIRKQYMHYNQNVIYFERYAAFYFACLLIFIDAIANEYITKFNWQGISQPKVYSPGFATIRDWIINLIEIVKSPE